MALTAVLAFSIGSFLLTLQSITSATTIQLANLSYKFVTTLTSRITHPSDPVTSMGWLGYAVCSSGMVLYILRPATDGNIAKASSPRNKGLSPRNKGLSPRNKAVSPKNKASSPKKAK
jgi:hypothetical protein